MNTHASDITPYQAGLKARKELPPVLPGDWEGSHQTTPALEEEIPDEDVIVNDTASPELYPRILRWVGAGTLGVAALCFLVSGWVDGSPLLRTGSFLGFTALLSAAGIFCAARWQEDKGARTFLALACAFLPANFAQLAAMIYAESNGSTGYSQGLKGVFTFEPVGLTVLLLTILGSLTLLMPIAYTGFSALARAGAKKMTALFLAANALLLLPWRDANLVALISGCMVAGLVLADRKWFAREAALRTWDGIAMRSLLFAPVGLLLMRNLIMHPVTAGMLSLIAALASLVGFAGAPRCLPWQKGRIASQFVGYACAFLSWAFLIEDFSSAYLWKEIRLPAFFIPWCMAVFGLSFKSEGKGVAARGMASVIAFAVCWANLEWFGDYGYLPSIIAMLTAVALLLTAFLLEERTVLVAGSAALLVAIGYHVHFALSMVRQNLWLSLALAGTSVILASSYLERHGIGLRQRAQRLRRHWQAWQ